MSPVMLPLIFSIENRWAFSHLTVSLSPTCAEHAHSFCHSIYKRKDTKILLYSLDRVWKALCNYASYAFVFYKLFSQGLERKYYVYTTLCFAFWALKRYEMWDYFFFFCWRITVWKSESLFIVFSCSNLFHPLRSQTYTNYVTFTDILHWIS